MTGESEEVLKSVTTGTQLMLSGSKVRVVECEDVLVEVAGGRCSALKQVA